VWERTNKLAIYARVLHKR